MTTETINALVRPAIIIMFAGALTWGFITRLISSEVFIGLAGPVIAWLFAERAVNKAHSDGANAALTIPPARPNEPLNPPGG